VRTVKGVVSAGPRPWACETGRQMCVMRKGLIGLDAGNSGRGEGEDTGREADLRREEFYGRFAGLGLGGSNCGWVIYVVLTRLWDRLGLMLIGV
jgi:hypothetical protein